MSPIRYVFFGTPRFARVVLEELLAANLTPVALVCNPDRPAGRKHVVTPPLTKELLHEQGLISHVPVFQPERLAEISEELAALRADIFVVAAYGKIIKSDILSLAKHGTIGVHPSLLPRYRGVAPIQQALLDGLAETGVTIFVVDEAVDHGAIIAADTVPVDASDDYKTLEEKLARVGGKLLARTLPQLFAGKLRPQEQDHTVATLTKKFATADTYVPWEAIERARTGDGSEAKRIHNMVRALNPEPGVWTKRGEKRLKLLSASLDEKGELVLGQVQWEGKRPGAYRE